jgi:hypothetical protein
MIKWRYREADWDCRKQPGYWISGFIAMTNAIMLPMAKPTIVPPATPRQSTFFRRLSFHTSKATEPLSRP